MVHLEVTISQSLYGSECIAGQTVAAKDDLRSTAAGKGLQETGLDLGPHGWGGLGPELCLAGSDSLSELDGGELLDLLFSYLG